MHAIEAFEILRQLPQFVSYLDSDDTKISNSLLHIHTGLRVHLPYTFKFFSSEGTPKNELEVTRQGSDNGYTIRVRLTGDDLAKFVRGHQAFAASQAAFLDAQV